MPEKKKAPSTKAPAATEATAKDAKAPAAEPKADAAAEPKADAKPADTPAPEAPPADKAFVGGVADPTFYDNAKCRHTYISPRKMEDFGLEMEADCPEGLIEQ